MIRGKRRGCTTQTNKAPSNSKMSRAGPCNFNVNDRSHIVQHQRSPPSTMTASTHVPFHYLSSVTSSSSTQVHPNPTPETNLYPSATKHGFCVLARLSFALNLKIQCRTKTWNLSVTNWFGSVWEAKTFCYSQGFSPSSGEAYRGCLGNSGIATPIARTFPLI